MVYSEIGYDLFLKEKPISKRYSYIDPDRKKEEIINYYNNNLEYLLKILIGNLKKIKLFISDFEDPNNTQYNRISINLKLKSCADRVKTYSEKLQALIDKNSNATKYEQLSLNLNSKSYENRIQKYSEQIKTLMENESIKSVIDYKKIEALINSNVIKIIIEREQREIQKLQKNVAKMKAIIARNIERKNKGR